MDFLCSLDFLFLFCLETTEALNLWSGEFEERKGWLRVWWTHPRLAFASPLVSLGAHRLPSIGNPSVKWTVITVIFLRGDLGLQNSGGLFGWQCCFHVYRNAGPWVSDADADSQRKWKMYGSFSTWIWHLDCSPQTVHNCRDMQCFVSHGGAWGLEWEPGLLRFIRERCSVRKIVTDMTDMECDTFSFVWPFPS